MKRTNESRFLAKVLTKGMKMDRDQWLTLPPVIRNYIRRQIRALYRTLREAKKWGEEGCKGNPHEIIDNQFSDPDSSVKVAISEQNMKICMRALGETENDRRERLKQGIIRWYDYDVYPEGPGQHGLKIKIGQATSKTEEHKKVRESLGRSSEAFDHMREGKPLMKKKKKKKKKGKEKRLIVTEEHMEQYKRETEARLKKFFDSD